MGKTVAAVMLAANLAAGCTCVRPAVLSGGEIIARRPFSHEEYAPVLKRFVDDQGRVDYGELRDQPEALDRYYFLVSLYGPDNHPELFPTEADRLAYWLNAYNAVVLAVIVAHDPVDSVTDIEPWPPLSFLPGNSGFFMFQRVTVGGSNRSLRSLKNRVIRRRFKDPRVHFALSFGTRGSPPLPRKPFEASRLEDDLDGAARAFVSEERNVRVDHQGRVVHLASIFEWYQNDFLDWLRDRHPDQDPTLVGYVARYASAEKAEALRRATGYEVRFNDHDWRLNGREDAP